MKFLFILYHKLPKYFTLLAPKYSPENFVSHTCNSCPSNKVAGYVSYQYEATGKITVIVTKSRWSDRDNSGFWTESPPKMVK